MAKSAKRSNRMPSLGPLLLLPVFILGCVASEDDPRPYHPGDKDTVVTGKVTDTDDPNDEVETGNGTGGEDEVKDTESKTIEPSCDNCNGIGEELENLACAIELCDDQVLIDQDYTSPTIVNATKLGRSRSAVAHFGNTSNDLKPLMGNSYALMSSGIAKGTKHNTTLNASTILSPNGKSVKDPFAPDEKDDAFDVVEWRVRLKAPATARGFKIHYVFFSVEYDEYIDREFNDKFYIFLEAQSTNGGKRTVINFTDCRDLSSYKGDFTCSGAMAAEGNCEAGKTYCYIAINTALSECCWYNGCPGQTGVKTDISGTGFSCGTEAQDYVGDYSMGYTFGSSTGWLYTQWPIEPNEEFDIIFHVHDTADSIFDSEVIIDKFVFVTEAGAETGVVVK